MKNQKGVSMITLIITIIVIIILAAIAFIGMDDATGSASFAGFQQEFGDYRLNFKTDAVAKLQEKYGVEGKSLTSAQLYSEAATGTAATAGHLIPAGRIFDTLADDLKDVDANQTLLVKGTDAASSTQCYEITDSRIGGYKDNHKFYGDNIGTERHFVTQNGEVFTVPGFPRTVDGEYRMYVTTDLYYVSDANYADVSANIADTAGAATTASTVTP